MNDNEKVIDGLCETISYLRLRSGDIPERCIKYQYDAIELLKGQEQKLVCPKCNGQPKGVICGICGQAVQME